MTIQAIKYTVLILRSPLSGNICVSQAIKMLFSEVARAVLTKICKLRLR